MDTEQLLSLIGSSNLSPEIKKAFIELEVSPEVPEMSICWRRYELKDKGLLLQFLAKSNWRYDYGMPERQFTEDWEEEFLQEIEFGHYGDGRRYPGTLPYGFVFGDSPADVQQKMKIKASEKGEGTYGSYLNFFTDDRIVFVAFDKQDQLIWMRVRPLELSFLKKRALEKSLRLQNKNISDTGLSQLQELKDKNPTTAWKQRMVDGDSLFTAEAMAETDTALRSFIAQLLVAVEKKKAAAVLSALKKTVMQLNKLNEKYDSFIETMEREELADFLHAGVRATGFKVEEDVDLTEEWREW